MKTRTLFEKELKEKLALKSTGKQSEESLILKAFKYFDLDNSGECNQDEFIKAVTKLGITGLSEPQLIEVFKSYDSNQNNELDYKEFACALYEEESSPKKEDKNDGPSEVSDEV